MANGDISQKLVADLRDYLRDHDRKIVPVDGYFYDELTDCQDSVMTDILTSRIVSEYPLITSQPDYTLDDKMLQITKIYFNEDIKYIPPYEISNTTVNDDSRKIVFEGSENFVTGTDFCYIECYIGPNEFDKISKTNDPILPKYLHHLLKMLVLSKFRHIYPELEDYDTVMYRISKRVYRRKAINRAIPLSIPNRIQF